MDEQTRDSIEAHTAALNDLTVELRTAGKRRRLLTIIGLAILAVLVVGFFRMGRTIVDQAQLNGRVTACGLSAALGNESKVCAEVQAAFARDGVPLTPNSAAQPDPRQNPAVALVLCDDRAIHNLPPPEGVTCPPPSPGVAP